MSFNVKQGPFHPDAGLAAASVPPGFPPTNFINPDTIGPRLIKVNIAAAVLTSVYLGLRLYTRICLVRQPGLDDVFIVLGWVFALAQNISTSVEVQMKALGRHKWDVEASIYSPHFLKLDSASSSFYFFSNMFTKCAVIYLFLRLAQAHSRWARWYLRFLLGFSVVYNLFGFIRLWLACKPVAALWDVSLQATATCIDRHTVFAALATMNIVVDTILVVSPLVMFGTLTLPFRQKAAVLALLMTGGLVCVISAIRLVRILHQPANFDDTRYLVDTICWTVAECGFGIICACAICLKPFVMRYSNWLASSTQSKSMGRTRTAVISNSYRSGGRVPDTYALGSLSTQHREEDLKLRPDLEEGPVGVNTSTITSGSSRTGRRRYLSVSKAPNDAPHNGSEGELVVDEGEAGIVVRNAFAVVEETVDITDAVIHSTDNSPDGRRGWLKR